MLTANFGPFTCQMSSAQCRVFEDFFSLSAECDESWKWVPESDASPESADKYQSQLTYSITQQEETMK